MTTGHPANPLAVDLAEYVRTLAPHDLPSVALRALLDGHESPSLAALAGVSAHTYDRWEIQELLASAVRELDLQLPSRAAAAQAMIDDSLHRALSGAITPVPGSRSFVWRVRATRAVPRRTSLRTALRS